jgi:hypothetical protein
MSELSYREMLTVEQKVARARAREESCSGERLRERNMAMGWFLARLFETMPTISKNQLARLVGAKEIASISLGEKDLTKRENAKISYDIKKVFEHVTKIKTTELF